MPCPSLLYTHPPEASELTKLPLQAPTQGFQVVLANLGVLWVCTGIGQRHEDHPPLERPEGSPVDASQTEQEVPTACPGETPYPISYASTVTQRSTRRTKLVTSLRVFEGKCRYRPSYSRGDISTPFM